MPTMTRACALALIYAALNAACAVALAPGRPTEWATRRPGPKGGGGHRGHRGALSDVARAGADRRGAAQQMAGAGLGRAVCGMAGGCFAAGQIFFVGGLLASAFAGVGWPVPIGGALFIIGWLALAGAGLAAWRAAGLR